MTQPIRFYSTSEVPYGVFSNFSAHPFELDGHRWPTSEHYFQAQKFVGTSHYDELRAASSPMAAARMGRSRKRPLRKDWERVKDDVMRAAVMAKFRAYPQLGELLCQTAGARLIEETTGDSYWGCGRHGTGKNMLGVILMETRATLIQELPGHGQQEEDL